MSQNQASAGVQDYGVVRGRPKAGKVVQPGPAGGHYHIWMTGSNGDCDVAVNVLSNDKSAVFYTMDHGAAPPQASKLLMLQDGYTAIQEHDASGLGIDFIKQQGLVDPTTMQTLPIGIALGQSDLHDEIDDLVQRAIADPSCEFFVFGSHYVDPKGAASNPWGIPSGAGIHDIHMNQLNPPGNFAKDNSSFHDGALLAWFPDQPRWLGAFICFDTQHAAWLKLIGKG